MKRILSIILTTCMVFAFTACGESANKNGEPEEESAEKSIVKISALRGPTTMGMVKLMSDSEAGLYPDTEYEVSIYGTADEIVTQLVKGEIDIANVPCNVASVLYGKTDNGISVVSINTMGVLYMVTSGDVSISSVDDLRGKKIYTTGKGTTPEYILNYILTQNGIDPEKDVELEFKSESAEIAALLSSAEGAENAVALLPQPYITIAQNANPDIKIVLNMQEEWEKVSEESNIVTGVTVIRKEFLENNPEAVTEFLKRYKTSIDYVNANTEEAAKLVAAYDIAPEPIALKALPLCSISFVTGNEMKTKIEGYLQVLYGLNPQSVGGTLPDEAFYYIEKS